MGTKTRGNRQHTENSAGANAQWFQNRGYGTKWQEEMESMSSEPLKIRHRAKYSSSMCDFSGRSEVPDAVTWLIIDLRKDKGQECQ